MTTKDAVTSDTEGQEKPVRKQLQKASISKAAGEALDTSSQTEEQMEELPERADAAEAAGDHDKPKPAPGLRKKRSHEEIEGDESDDRPAAHTRSQQHTRKRSRDSTAEEDELNNGRKISGERKRDDSDVEGAVQSNGAPEAQVSDRPGTPEPKVPKRGEEKVEAMTSPKTKRSRLHSATAEGESATTALSEEADTKAAETAVDEPPDTHPPAKAAPEASVEAASETKSPTATAASGFANTSSTSPFGAMAPKSPPSEQAQTSASAFAASGFGSLAGAATSGFGALGKTSGGPAGGWASKKSDSSEAQNGTEKSTSTFGGALGQQSAFGGAGGSTFGSGTSAFGGKLGGGSSAFGGSGFGSLGGLSSSSTSGGLSSFASGKPSPFASASGTTPTIGKPSTRPFGAPADENDEDDEGADDESGLKSPLSQTSEDKQDERFFAQEHETGEEGEVTAYSCRAKLYNFATVDAGKGKKEWKERGLGTVRLNVARPAAAEGAEGEGGKEGGEEKVRARLVMRADGSHRLILNTPVQKDIKFGAANGGPPQSGVVLFMGAVDGKKTLEMLQLKCRQQFALELYEKIRELQEGM